MSLYPLLVFFGFLAGAGGARVGQQRRERRDLLQCPYSGAEYVGAIPTTM